MILDYRVLLLLALCSAAACAVRPTGDINSDRIVMRAADGIVFCQQEYLERARKLTFPRGADRAYVLSYRDQTEILFTSGAKGKYEQRSEFYRAYLFCTLLGRDHPSVEILIPSQEDQLLYNDDLTEIFDLGDEKGPVTSLIFLKQRRNFRYWKKFEFETIGDYKKYQFE